MWDSIKRIVFRSTVVVVILGMLFFWFLDRFPAEGFRKQAFQRVSESARESMWPLMIVALLLCFAAVWLLMMMHSLFERFGRCNKWRSETSSGIVLGVPLLVLLGGVLWNVLALIEIPSARRLPVVQAAFVETENLGWITTVRLNGPRRA